MIAATASTVDAATGSTTTSAPSARARSRRRSDGSAATTVATPIDFSQCTAPSPMIPRPNTTATSPGFGSPSRVARRATASGSTSAPARSETASGSLKIVWPEQRLRHQHAVGEGPGDAVADVEPAPGLAQVHVAREAAVAAPARRERADRHAVAVAEAVHARRREHRSGELVAQDLAGARPEAALVGAQVRAADAALGHLDERLPVGGDGIIDLGEVEALGFDPLGSTHTGIRASLVPARARLRPGRCGPRQARVNGPPPGAPAAVRILRMADPGDRVEAVMFDMDGTLLDSWDALLGAYQDATTEVLGKPFPVERADIDHLIQLSARDAFPTLAGGDLELAKRIQAAFGESYRSRSAQISLYDGVKEMLVALRDQGLKLGIATSKSRVRLDPDLEQTGIGALLDATICGDEVPAAKPDPAPIVAIMEMLGVAPAARAVRGRRRQRRPGRPPRGCAGGRGGLRLPPARVPRSRP